jgi:pimeloyl-ACP methyl ester carboxylesterase
MNYFILPGNPPAKHFYNVWANEIRERSPQSQTAVASYPLLSGCSDSQEYFRQLARSVAAQFLEFRQSAPGASALVGHSLGGYLALKIYQEMPELVDACYLFHPFLRQPEARGRFLLKLAHDLRRFSSLETWLVRARPLVGLFLPEAHRLSDEEIHVFTQLAYHEHLSIAQDRTAPLLSEELQKKLHIYSTNGDTWCPPASISMLGTGLRHVNGAASHNFVVRKSERDLVFDFLRIV